MVRFVHTADWQLGMTRHFLGPDAQPRFSAARIEVIDAIGRLAEEHHASFVVVAGDVFETNHVERQVVVRALEAMARHPQVRFLLLPGNHDPLDAGSVFRSRAFAGHQPANVQVLDGSAVAVAPGVEVVGAPWRNKHPGADLAAAALADVPVDGTIRILVAHGAVDLLNPDRSQPSTIALGTLESALRDGRIHHVALGDRHSTTSVGSTGRIWYSGAPEPTDFRETDAGNALVVELSAGAPAVVEPHRVGRWRFAAHEAQLAGPADVGALHSFLDALPHKAETIVRLRLVGQLSVADTATLEEVVSHHTDLLASLETWAPGSDLTVVPDPEDFGHLELAGFAREALEDLQALVTAGTDPAASDALALLYRMARGAA